jgi:hypothetical protein
MQMRSGGIVLVLALGLAALWLAGCATTETKKPKSDKEALCSVLDTNKDGKITKEEFMARTSDKAKGLEVFEKCDTQKKGYLSYDEFWAQRLMFPPSLWVTTPLVQPMR